MNSGQLAQLAGMAESAEDDLKYVGIFSPTFSQREDIPNVLLPEVFTAENVNVVLHDHKISRIKMRLPEFLEATFALGTVSVTSGSPTVTLSAASWASSATHIPGWVGRAITITDSGSVERVYEILSVTYHATNSIITLTENYAGATEAGRSYSIGTAGTEVQTPDANTIMRFHRLVKESAGSETEYLLAFTTEHAYVWSTSWTAWVLKFTCGSACDTWETVDLNQELIATNNKDFIQVWGSTVGDAFANLIGASGIEIGTGSYIQKAKFITVYENYVLLGWTTVDGTTYPNRIDWSKYDDSSDWTQVTSGPGSVIIGDGGFMRGFGHYLRDLIVAKEKMMFRMWLVPGTDVFNNARECDFIGCGAPHSMVNDADGRMYWFASDDTIRRLPGAVEVSRPKVKTFKNLHAGLKKNIESYFINDYNLLVFSVPYGSTADENNLVTWHDPTSGGWGDIDVAISCFGCWTRQSVYTWATLPFDMWKEWGWESWAGPENTVGFYLDLCADYSGYGYDMHMAELDDSEAYSGHFVLSTDMIQKTMVQHYGTGMRGFKRLEYMQLWFEREAQGTAFVYIKRDNEKAWVSIKSDLDLTDAAGGERTIFPIEVDMVELDMRAMHYLLKIGGNNRFRFVGVILGFLPDGAE